MYFGMKLQTLNVSPTYWAVVDSNTKAHAQTFTLPNRAVFTKNQLMQLRKCSLIDNDSCVELDCTYFKQNDNGKEYLPFGQHSKLVG